MGADRRGLPWDLEASIYEMLTVSDFGAVCLVSKLNKQQIVRFLDLAKELHSADDLAPRQREWQLIALRLAAEHCRALTTINIGRLATQRYNEEPSHAAKREESLLTALVTNNQQSILSSSVTNTALLACNNLETLDLRYQETVLPSASAWPTLSRLRALTVDTLDHYPPLASSGARHACTRCVNLGFLQRYPALKSSRSQMVVRQIWMR